MKEYKIRIPCEEVSRLVQEKAFSEGFVHLYLEGHDWYFSSNPLPEISWQEYLYGEGWLFKRDGYDYIFFQAKSNNRVYWIDNGNIGKTTYNRYGPEHYKSWVPCDMHGNTLTIKQESNIMKQELNYTIPWKVKYNNKAELDVMRAAFKGLGCELYSNLEDYGWTFVCCSGGSKFLEQCGDANIPTVDLLTAIAHLLTPVKSQEQLDSERKIAELEDTINKAKMEMEKAGQQIRELKGK